MAAVISIHRPAPPKPFSRPLFTSVVRAGFPSPADDHLERDLDGLLLTDVRQGRKVLRRKAGSCGLPFMTVEPRIVEYLKRKDAAFRVIDTHAGAGLYDLSSEEAQKTGEWRTGIGKLLGQSLEQPVATVEVVHAVPASQPTAPEPHVATPAAPVVAAAPVAPTMAPPAPKASELKEQHFTILYGDTGYSYESIIGPYLQGAKSVVIEDPYIRLQHQIQNFVRFCETVLKAGTVKKISLITGYDDKTQLADIAEKLDELKQSLLELDVELEVKLNPNMHDREIRIDNGWVIKIGRGLDFFQKPGGWFEVGANDLSLRKCLETKVDIFRA